MFQNLSREQIKEFFSGVIDLQIDEYLLQNKNLQQLQNSDIDPKTIPQNFDSRQQWPKCKSIKEIRNQSKCGSCWAMAAVEVFSDRWCIATHQTQQVRFSTENVISCCDFCGHGCKGGNPVAAWDYFKKSGVVQGGPYNTTNLCQAYSFKPLEYKKQFFIPGKTPKCRYQCDQNYTGNETYYQNLRYTKYTSLITDKNVQRIQSEILKNGPVEASHIMYEDFFSYKSGVYQHHQGISLGSHAVKIIGWGNENEIPYWLCANSFGTGFGMDGFFKILRGKNECGIEQQIVFGTPDLKRRF